MADKTRIDWADATWNPVTGCLHGCPYCYAREMANRFKGVRDSETPPDADGKPKVLYAPCWKRTKAGKRADAPYPYGFDPTFHCYRLDIPVRWQRPRNIFVCSMADLFGAWVPDEWIEEVFNVCRKAPQHRYLFLTKAPERFKELVENGVKFPDNCWLGTSVTRSKDAEGNGGMLDKLTDTWNVPGVRWFASIEPMLEKLSFQAIENLAVLDWVIIGAETGIRKNKVIPEKSWIDRIARRLRYYHVPFFMKESVRDLMGADFRQEYPWEA